MNKRFARTTLATLLAAAAFLPLQAHAGFTGQTVTLGHNLENTMSDVVFNATAMTIDSGPEIEFLGRATDGFGQQWSFSIDITDTSVVFSWNESTRVAEPNGGNISSVPDAFSFDLSFSGGALPPMSLLSFTSAGNYSPGTPSLNLNNPAPNVLHAGFQRLDATDVYTISAVPEPETYALLLAGLGLMGGIARRRARS